MEVYYGSRRVFGDLLPTNSGISFDTDKIIADPAAPLLTNEQFMLLNWIQLGVSGLSALACLITLATYGFWRPFRTPANRIVGFVAISDLGTAIAMILGYWANSIGGSFCLLQATLIQWSDLSSAAWTAAMAANLLMVLFMSKATKNLDLTEKYYFFVCLGLTFLISYVPIFIRSNSLGLVYGKGFTFCWIRSDWTVLRFALYYAPIWFIFLLNLVIYFIASIEVIRRTSNLSSNTMSRPNSRPLTMASIDDESKRRADSRLSVFSDQSIGTKEHRSFSGWSDATPSKRNTIYSVMSASTNVSAHSSGGLLRFRTRYFSRIFIFLTAYLVAWILPTMLQLRPMMVGSPEYLQSDFAWYVAQVVTLSMRGLVNFLCFYSVALSNTLSSQK